MRYPIGCSTTLRMWRGILLGGAALACMPAFSPVRARAQTATPELMSRLKAYRFGADAKVLDDVAQWATAARAQPNGRREASRALVAVLQSDAAFDAKSIACRWLVSLASEEQVPVLAAALRGDEHLAHYALMVLARIPGKAADTALRRELAHARGNTLLAVIDALGERHDTAAIPLLARYTRGKDVAVAVAAANALAKLPGAKPYYAVSRRVGRILLPAYAAATGARRHALGHALLQYAERAQKYNDKVSAFFAYRALDRAPSTPLLRAAALRELVLLSAEHGYASLADALDDDGSPRQKVALDLARTIPGDRMTRALSAYVVRGRSRARASVVGALGDRGDPRAIAVVMRIWRNGSSSERLAALRAMATLADASAVPVLLNAAALLDPEERSAARASLARLRGTGVDGNLLSVVSGRADPAVRVAAIIAVGNRRSKGAVPCLVAAMRAADTKVRAAALGVLKEMGGPAEVPALLDLLHNATASARDDITGAIGEVARRGATETERTGAITARLAAVPSAADRADLLTLLGEIGGPRALSALRAALSDPLPDVRLAALRQLAEWPTGEPLEGLLAAVRSASDGRERAVAMRGYVRMLGAAEERAPDEALALYRDAVGMARTTDERKLVLSGLAHVKTVAGLRLAAGLAGEPEVRAEAEAAAVEIGRGTIGAYPEETRSVLEPIAKGTPDEETRKRAIDVLALPARMADFVAAWQVSPAYRQDEANYAALFDITFLPEQADRAASVPWRLMPVATSAEQPWLLDLLALHGGEQKVAYLRTRVWSDTDHDLVLELGTDDGAKVWWNGQPAFALNVQRGVAPAQDKVRLRARSGWNDLLLKVTQNIMGWGACARFTNADGTAAAGLRYAVP